MNRKQIIRQARRALRKTGDYSGRYGAVEPDEFYQLAYILGCIDEPQSIFAYGLWDDQMRRVHLFRGNPYQTYIDDWAYTLDDDLFGWLEDGMDILYMTPECHAGVWYQITCYYGFELEHVVGMQKYITFGRNHGITRKKLCNLTDYDGSDIWTLDAPAFVWEDVCE
jgi:hypothetical protein